MFIVAIIFSGIVEKTVINNECDGQHAISVIEGAFNGLKQYGFETNYFSNHYDDSGHQTESLTRHMYAQKSIGRFRELRAYASIDTEKKYKDVEIYFQKCWKESTMKYPMIPLAVGLVNVFLLTGSEYLEKANLLGALSGTLAACVLHIATNHKDIDNEDPMIKKLTNDLYHGFNGWPRSDSFQFDRGDMVHTGNAGGRGMGHFSDG